MGANMLAEQSKLPNRYTETWIYLDPSGDGELKGIFYHPAEKRAWRFLDAVSLIGLHEQLFETVNYPQSTHQLRDMRVTGTSAKEKNRSMEELDKSNIPDNKTPTFVINVQYRQNASWQGTIRWVEGGIEKRFRSTLELIRLMDSVIGDNDTDWK